MLVSRLYELFRKNIPKPERAAFKECPRGEGIWDILGYYDYKSRVKITICEPKIREYSKKLTKKLDLDETQIRLMLRELVRLHEHAHALLHTGNFGGGIKRRFKMGYQNFPKGINEPLTEFIGWSVVCNVGIQPFEIIFNEIDKNAPNYYRKWNQIRGLIDSKSKPNSKNYVYFVPGLVQVAREQKWDSFDHFLKGIQRNYPLIDAFVRLL